MRPVIVSNSWVHRVDLGMKRGNALSIFSTMSTWRTTAKCVLLFRCLVLLELLFHYSQTLHLVNPQILVEWFVLPLSLASSQRCLTQLSVRWHGMLSTSESLSTSVTLPLLILMPLSSLYKYIYLYHSCATWEKDQYIGHLFFPASNAQPRTKLMLIKCMLFEWFPLLLFPSFFLILKAHI